VLEYFYSTEPESEQDPVLEHITNLASRGLANRCVEASDEKVPQRSEVGVFAPAAHQNNFTEIETLNPFLENSLKHLSMRGRPRHPRLIGGL
jgi:hypothetical protein